MDEPIKLDDYLATTYLIGSMEKTAQGDDGSSQREGIEKELLARNVYPFNPVKLEAAKTGMTTEDIKEKMKGWVASGKWELFGEKARQIWLGHDEVDTKGRIIHVMGDVDYVLSSSWITMNFHKGDVPCGTFAEAGIALEHGIPIYLITDFKKNELPKSLLQIILATDGEVFENNSQYLNFLDEKYELKKKEEKKEEKK